MMEIFPSVFAGGTSFLIGTNLLENELRPELMKCSVWRLNKVFISIVLKGNEALGKIKPLSMPSFQQAQ